MRKTVNKKKISSALTLILLLTLLSGCGWSGNSAVTAEPVLPAGTISPAASSGSPEAEAKSERQDGERFETVILLEGTEEPVRYEHVRNDTIGIEMDYDYESFVRHSEDSRECFLSLYDDPQNPENYLEVTYSPDPVDAVTASVSEGLSKEYEILTESCLLDRAGSCIRIEASGMKNNAGIPARLQTVYIIPAADGSRVAAAHYTVESAEGFGRRFSYIMNTLSVIDRNGK